MRILPVLALLLVFNGLKGQDSLYFKNSAPLAVKVMEINPDNVKYKRFDNVEGPTYTTLKTELKYVVFKNKTKEAFETPPAQTPTSVTATDTAKATNTNNGNDFFSGSRADTIYFRSGKVAVAKVLIINEKEVRYKLFNFQDGPTYQAAKYELKQICYGNGKTEQFGEEKPLPKPDENNNISVYSESGTGSSSSLAKKGAEDAKFFYGHNAGTGWIGTLTILFSPIVGFIPTIVVANCQPKIKNLGMPPSSYMHNKEYLKSYQKTAYKMKRKKVWTCFGVCSGVWLGLYLLTMVI